MNISQPPTTKKPHRGHVNAARHREDGFRRALPLTDDQYVNTSLALVADLSRRVREERDAPVDHAARKFCRTGFKPS